MVVQRQVIPEGLAEMAPGPELAAVLGGLDLRRLSGYDAVLVLQAYARLEAHVQARKALVMAEVGLYVPSPDDMRKAAVPDEYAADEVRAALVLTRRAAEREYAFAHDLCTRLPRVWQALLDGRIDKPRALVVSEWLEDVPAGLARAVADQVLPAAGRSTTSRLAEMIKRLLVAADPSWARRRYERAVQRRRVEGRMVRDGTACITGHQLPLDQAAAAIGRVNAVAQQAKAAGLAAPIDHVRTDIFLGLLDGSLTGLDDDGIITALLAQAAHRAPAEDDDDPDIDDHPNDDGRHPTADDPDHPDGLHGPDVPDRNGGSDGNRVDAANGGPDPSTAGK
ncbi:DUF222 domain-containing protein, partial [Planotetraspora thailandica]